MVKLIGFLCAMVLGCGVIAQAQSGNDKPLFTDGKTEMLLNLLVRKAGEVGPLYFNNTTHSPVWVTVYTKNADNPVALWSIAGTHCVKPTHVFRWSGGANAIKVKAEVQKGHGNLCNTGTYWTGTTDAVGKKSDASRYFRVKLTSLPSGATTIDGILGPA